MPYYLLSLFKLNMLIALVYGEDSGIVFIGLWFGQSEGVQRAALGGRPLPPHPKL